MTEADMQTNSQRSTFVSVVAWIFIVISGFAVLIAILQNLMFAFISTQPEFNAAFQKSAEEGVPDYVVFIFEHLQLIVFIVLLLMVVFFAASIGLLLRKNWARRVFIGYMFLTALYMVIGTLVQYGIMGSMMQPLGGEHAPPSSFVTLFKAMQYTIMVFNTALGLVLGWIGWKLMRPAIKAEFIPQ